MKNKRNPGRYEQMLFERFVGSVLRPDPNLGIGVQSDPNQSIRHLRPHYTDDRFKTARTVYLARGYTLDGEYVKGAHYNYSDRYRSWFSYEAWEKARDTAKAQFPDMNCAAHIEVFLRAIHDDPQLTLVHIMAGFNVSNGYDYQVYGFIPGNKEATPDTKEACQ